MLNFIKNKFLFIITISIITLIALVLGAMSLYQDNSYYFAKDGYIIETSNKTNQKYYFSANTKYKENVEEKVTFKNKENEKVSVDTANFVHYQNGDISFLQKGALVNLTDITSPMISYYNISRENIITYDQGQYLVTSNNKKINIESFIGRINDKKYIIASKDLSLKIPTEDARISGEYFEINYIEEGIVKIYNENIDYQVTAQDSYIYIGENITINLADGKIFYDGDAKMLLSQITINNDENIDLDIEKDKTGSGGSGNGDGTGNGETGNEGTENDGTSDGTGEGTGDGTETGDGTSTGEGTGSDEGNGTGINTGDSTTASPQIELIEAAITSTTIDLTMQLNNASLARGNVVAYLTNVATGKKETPKRIELTNGTFELPYSSLTPNTDYSLTIVETEIANEKQYFQKTFKTKELGLNLEKTYATDNSLAYNLIFDENAEVTRAHISIYDNNGTNVDISPNEFTISKDDLNNSAIFTGLKSNTSYSINVDTIWINNTAYSNLYTINRIDTTLKKTPTLSGINVSANTEEVKFTIELKNDTDTDTDTDKSIISYTYNVYLADDITLDNPEPEVQYTVTKNDSDPLVLNLNEIDELKTGVDYRCKIIAEYNDNDMIREVSTDYSNNFLIRSKPNITFELKNATMNKVEGTIKLLDANCTVPINGRACSNKSNNFTLRYYELTGQETTENDKKIYFDSQKLTYDLSLTDLKSNTTYAVKVFGNYYDDDDVLHPNVQIGDTFFVTTDKSENIYFEVAGDNISGYNKDGSANPANVVTFDAKLTAPQNSTIIEEIGTITFNLYSGRYNTKEKLIGSYTITDKTSIEDLFSNINIKNSLFDDTTSNKVGKIDTLEKLIKLTNNATGTLNQAYTVEVENVYDTTGKNKIIVENNVYTFNLTSSYYLDARIETNPKENYITVTPILKENLTEEEYQNLSKTVKNLDDLNDDTVVGLNIENSLSDIFVDSAFNYEKATVNYVICNETINNCDNLIEQITDNNLDNDENAKKLLKILSVDMGNKYQPKTQTIYLDSSEYTDAKKYFIRGYKYRIGYTINFTTEDGSNPIYTNKKLYKILPIEKQSPLYTQYISTSNSSSITYRYNFRDIDSAIADQNFYYTLGDDKNNYYKIDNSLIADGTNQEVTIPIDNDNIYTLYYSRKNTNNKADYIAITTNDFEKEYSYDNTNAFTILDIKGNVLKIKLEDNDANNRAIAYKVVIKSKDQASLGAYTRYFLASKLNTISESSGTFDSEGNEITIEHKYIDIDYANISKFMGQNLTVNIYSYYNSGLKGYNLDFTNGLILKNRETNKYLNIYNSGSNTTSTTNTEDSNMGLYLLKEPYSKDDQTIFIYNKLMDTKNYNPLLGASYYDTQELAENIGIKFDITPTNAGMSLTSGKNNYLGYDAILLKESKLATTNNNYKFETIIPTINVVTNSKNTINSLKIDIEPKGIYGNNQFIKNGVSHNKIYIELYEDEECTNLLTTKATDINIIGSDTTGYTATINTIEFQNLHPETTYYFKVYAYINNTKTQLYDSSSTTTYITKTYQSKTLDAKGIISGIKFSVTPKTYNNESSKKELVWKLNLKNTENYKIRFELREPDGTNSSTDLETGETIETTNYQLTKFDGTTANSCDFHTNGSSGNGYVSNCYISVPKEEVSTVNKKEQKYSFTGDDFVFGGEYYQLIIYAIPYTNGNYLETEKVLLYQNDSLTTTPITTINGVTQDITIPNLEEASFSLSNSLTAGYANETDGYYISFVPTVYDTYKVIKYGSYTIKLLDSSNTEIKTLYNVTSGIPETGITNETVRFTGLTSNTLYYIQITYETYRNNNGLSDTQKAKATPFTDFIYTPISNDITLGTITASQTANKSVTLTYNGSSNLSEKIVAVDYTISLKGGSSKTNGTYRISSGTPNIFTITSDRNPRLAIDTSDNSHSDNTSFTFKSGNTYIITTRYYYRTSDNNEELLTDQVTGNTTYTTILNL